MLIRPALPPDREIAAVWARMHGQELNPAMLPPIGIVCEDAPGMEAGMCWIYLSCNVGVAFVEFLVLRPGLILTEQVRIGAALMDGIEAAAKALGYTVLVAYSLPACARYLHRFGWKCDDPRAKTAMHKVL